MVGDASDANRPQGQVADPTRGEIQDYIADMLEELRDLASTSGLGSLAAILELATRSAQVKTAAPLAEAEGAKRR